MAFNPSLDPLDRHVNPRPNHSRPFDVRQGSLWGNLVSVGNDLF